MTVKPGDKTATCSECACVEEYEDPLDEHDLRSVLAVEFRWLCNDCWHRARSKQQAYRWIRDDGYTGPNSATYLRHEAESYTHWDGPRWRLEPVEHWYGDRIAHPGYLAKRRAAILEAP